MKHRIALLLSLIVVATAHAQLGPADEAETATEDLEPVRRYTVEMIIFSYAEDVAVGSEVFVPEWIEPEIDLQATEPEPTDEPVAEDTEQPEAYRFEFQTLPDDELTMTDTLGRLERLDAYDPLMHFGWTQTTIAKEQTPTLPLARFAEPPAGLGGTLQLYLSRFLHLVVDVSLAAPEGSADEGARFGRFDAPVAVYSDERQVEAYELGAYAPLRYSIFEDRIMKNGETRYYDHPKFGVITKVTRVEEEPAADADAAESVLP